MGKTGPKPARADGYHVTRKGYLRKWLDGRMQLAHRVEWELHRGPVPDGMQIHHRNGDKQDNRIENLEILDAITHKRLHEGCQLRGGTWWKLCPKCGEWKPIDEEHWYFCRQGWPMYRCKPCHRRGAVRVDEQAVDRRARSGL